MLYMGAVIGFFFTAQFVQSVYHWPPLQGGLSFLQMTLVNFFFAVRVPRLLERFGRPRVLAAGVVLTTVGMAWLSRLEPAHPLPDRCGPADGGHRRRPVALAPMTSSGVDGVAPEDAGAGSGLVNTVHQIGRGLALSILTAVAATVFTGHTAADITARSAIARTGSAVLLALAVAAVLTLVVPARASRK
ncbi:hypothetical protein [Streptomyces sp. NPDC040750]|uniref:hypothetical protein n=1 Tax=Streptomyces sp. NPDC040750 TaxID=3154491 RepID=UPI00340D0233